jgi:hypothetical protein
MARLVPLTLNENNYETVHLTVTSDVLIDPATAVFEMLIKDSPDAADDDATVLNGDAITVITTESAKVIYLDAEVPPTAIATPGERFWRLDVLIDDKPHAALYGPLTIRNL